MWDDYFLWSSVVMCDNVYIVGVICSLPCISMSSCIRVYVECLHEDVSL